MSRFEHEGRGEQVSRGGQESRGDHDDRQDDNETYDPAYTDEQDYDVHHLVVESASSIAAQRRRRKALITLAVLLLGLFFAFWWAYSYYKASGENPTGGTPGTSASAAPTCTPVDPNAVTPDKVTVNVFNATKRAGLAGSVSKEFAAQGYVLGKVANDPAKKAITAPAEVRYGPTGKTAAELVMTSIGKGAVPVEDTRGDATVDVALGDGFSALVALPSASPSLPTCPASPAPSPSS